MYFIWKDCRKLENKIQYYLKHKEETSSSGLKLKILESECSEEKYANKFNGEIKE